MILFVKVLLLLHVSYLCDGVQILKGTNDFVTYYVGNTNLIITVPHNGRIRPNNIPNRGNGCMVNNNCVYNHQCSPTTSTCSVKTFSDSYTKTIAKKVYDEYYALTGLYPHMIVSELRRIKLDPNREINEATFGDPIAVVAYNEYHNFISQAKNSLNGPGLLLDIHGQTHPEEWVELGYLFSKNSLVNGNMNPQLSSARSLFSLHNVTDFENILRGPNSFGKLLNDYSYKVVPSPINPDPTSNGNYFSGGYTVKIHGSKDGGSVDAIQVEIPRGIRFSSSNRSQFSKDLAKVTKSFRQSFYT